MRNSFFSNKKKFNTFKTYVLYYTSFTYFHFDYFILRGNYEVKDLNYRP